MTQREKVVSCWKLRSVFENLQTEQTFCDMTVTCPQHFQLKKRFNHCYQGLCFVNHSILINTITEYNKVGGESTHNTTTNKENQCCCLLQMWVYYKLAKPIDQLIKIVMMPDEALSKIKTRFYYCDTTNWICHSIHKKMQCSTKVLNLLYLIHVMAVCCKPATCDCLHHFSILWHSFEFINSNK